MATIVSVSILYKDYPREFCDAGATCVLAAINDRLAGRAKKLRVRHTYKDKNAAIYWLSPECAYRNDYTALRVKFGDVPAVIAIDLGYNPFETFINSDIHNFGCELVSLNLVHAGSRVVNVDNLARDICGELNTAGGFGGPVNIRRVKRNNIMNTYWFASRGEVSTHHIILEYSPGMDTALALFELGPDPLDALLSSNIFNSDYHRCLATY